MHIPHDLTQSARHGDLNILVGSGISVDAGLPSWRELLYQLCDCISDATIASAVERLITQNRLLDAAELLRSDVSPERICKRLRQILRPSPGPTPLADALWRLRAAMLVTTNYDSILEAALIRIAAASPSVIIPGDGGPPFFPDHGQSLAKLHGCLSRPDSIVLSKRDYFRTMLTLTSSSGGIWSELIRRPTLAVGYSLTDPDLQLLLYWSQERFGAFAQPFFLLLPTVPDEERILLELIPGVVLIQYDAGGGHREPLLDVLGQLRRERDGAERHAPSILEIRGAMLRQLNKQLLAFLHDTTGQFLAASEILTRALGQQNLGDAQERNIHQLQSILAEARQSLHTALDILRSGDDHLAPASWNDARTTLLADLSESQYSGLTYTIADPAEYELPIGSRLYSVLVRVLVDNAIEASNHSPSGVSLDLRVKPVGTSPQLAAEVRDHGSGIAPELIEHIFEPNVSTKGGDRGLGLYLLRALADQVGGGVELASTQGRGTFASFHVPVRALTASAPLNTPNIALDALRLKGRHIVVVDDDSTLCDQYAKLLTSTCGAQVQTFKDGESAMRYLRDCGDPPDCVISDMVMPQMSGFDLIRSVRERWPRIPVLLYSGYAFSSSLTDDALGPVVFLRRPFAPQQLLNAIETSISRVGGLFKQ